MEAVSNTPTRQWVIRGLALLAVLMSAAFSWLVFAAGTLQPNVANIITQVLMVAVIISLLAVVIRRFQQTRKRLETTRATAEKEAALLRKRSAFIYGASSQLGAKLTTFEKAIAQLDPSDVHVVPLTKKTAELRRLLDRLETISKLEANMALTSKTTVEVGSLLDEVAASYQPQFTAAGAEVKVVGPHGIMVDGDAEMLREVFIAIVDNAAKFMPTQGGLLDVSYGVHRQHLQITFTDNGSGIAADKLPELFQPFSRVDGVMAFNRQGQGLSLYISKLCIEIMGGSIDLTSQPKVGTTVTIHLPVSHKHQS